MVTRYLTFVPVEYLLFWSRLGNGDVLNASATFCYFYHLIARKLDEGNVNFITTSQAVSIDSWAQGNLWLQLLAWEESSLTTTLSGLMYSGYSLHKYKQYANNYAYVMEKHQYNNYLYTADAHFRSRKSKYKTSISWAETV